ncbi:MAG: DsbC family protein [Gammaproteobacteria bacterium]|nr:DsbC family protein [Gammaproteobacteria bacterium]MCW8924249.1 DsbC family protein [Gammaproteobacteria bacterium]
MGLFRTVFSHFFLPFSLLLASFSVLAADEGIEKLRKALAKNMPRVEITQISQSPVPGLYEVIVGSQIVYMDQTARYMLDGDLVDLASRVNHTERAKSKIRTTAIDALGEDNMLVYTPKQVDHTVTVVTDIDCPYCRRLHSEMSEYMANNIKVRYIFMPLKGKSDFDTTVSVWCAEDKNNALDLAKSGAEIEALKCENPIKDHLALAREIGIRGTPAIILETGEMLPGYVPIAKLVKELKTKTAAVYN